MKYIKILPSIFLAILLSTTLTQSQEVDGHELVVKWDKYRHAVTDAHGRTLPAAWESLHDTLVATWQEAGCNRLRKAIGKQCEAHFKYALGSSMVMRNDTSLYDDLYARLDILLKSGTLQKCTSGPKPEKIIKEMKAVIKMAKKKAVERSKKIEHFLKVGNYINSLYNMDNQINKTSGSIQFGYTGNGLVEDAQAGTTFNLASTLSMDRYPGELEFSTNFTAQVDQKSFQESVSNIFLSYDHDIGKNTVGRDLFGFMSRYTNSYLGLQQRIVGGLGYSHSLVNFGLNDKGQENLKKIETWEGLIDKKKNIDLIQTGNTGQFHAEYPGKLAQKQLDDIGKYRHFVNKANRKAYGRHRFNFLLAGLVEMEQFESPDSLRVKWQDGDTMVVNTEVFDPSINLRLEIGFSYHGLWGKHIAVNLRTYYIFDVLEVSPIVIDPPFVNERIVRSDSRYEIHGSISTNFPRANFLISFVYNRDLSPLYQEVMLGEQGSLFELPNQHILGNATFSYNIDR